MEIKRTTEMFVETHRRIRIRQSDPAKQFLCPNCGEPRLTAEQIAVLLGISRRRVYRRIETGAWHFIEDADGIAFVCSRSLEENLLNREKNL